MDRLSIGAAALFALVLSACNGGGGGSGDNGGLPLLSIDEASVAEGDAGSVELRFTASLAAPLTEAVSVDYRTEDAGGANSATAGSDYIATSGTLTVDAGADSATLVVEVLGDEVIEADERLHLVLENPSANVGLPGGGGSLSLVGTILNDDHIILNIDAAAIDEGDNGSQALQFNAYLEEPAKEAMSVQWRTAGGSATADVDFTAASGSLDFAVGSTTPSTPISVQIHGDTRLEADETFGFTIESASISTVFGGDAATLGNALATIRNDDQLQASVDDAAIDEGDSGSVALSFPVKLSDSADVDIEIDYVTADDSASVADDDYSESNDTLIIPAGQTSGSIAVPVLGDTRVEPDEQFTLRLTGATSGVVLADASASGTIRNDDQPSLSIDDVSRPEGDAAGTLDFIVQLDHPALSDIEFDWATSDNGSGGGYAQAGDDYTASGANGVVIAAGSSSVTLSVPIDGDLEPEADEQFAVALSNISGDVTVLRSSAVGTLEDDDVRYFSVADAQLAEGDAGSAAMRFELSLQAAAITNVSVDYRSVQLPGAGSEPGIASDGVDYSGVSGTATIAAGSRSVTIDVPVHGDLLAEGDETFAFELSKPTAVTAAIADGEAVGLIIEDDFVTASIDDRTLFEGDADSQNLTFTVTLTGPAVVDVGFDYASVESLVAPHASPGFDYTAVAGNITIPAGGTEAKIDVVVFGDAAVELDERFDLQLSGLPDFVLLPDDRGTATIFDDDLAGLNDTTIDRCADADSYGLDCNDNAAGTSLFPGQDAEFGRDAVFADDADGIAGLSFSKVGADGVDLPPEAAEWACVRDNVTGLIWEAKTGDGGLRDAVHSYSWFNSDATSNGTDTDETPPLDGSGTADGGSCADAGRCDTEKFVADVNASGLCGYSDWRLPRVDELRSIIAMGGADDGFDVDTNYFPLASGNEVVWTDTPEAASAAVFAWAIDFKGGFQINKRKSEVHSARLVRGTFLRPLDTPIASPPTQNCRETIRPSAPAARFTDNGDGTVTDLDTGLMWKRCPEGLPGANCDANGALGVGFDYAAVAYTWQGALQRVQAVNASADPDVNPGGHGDWRLPNIKELGSIVERACVNPALNLSLFPGDYKDRSGGPAQETTTDVRFWSASPDAVDGSRAWMVRSFNGDDLRSAKAEAQVPNQVGVQSGYSYWVRLVRDTN